MSFKLNIEPSNATKAGFSCIGKRVPTSRPWPNFVVLGLSTLKMTYAYYENKKITIRKLKLFQKLIHNCCKTIFHLQTFVFLDCEVGRVSEVKAH